MSYFLSERILVFKFVFELYILLYSNVTISRVESNDELNRARVSQLQAAMYCH